MFCHRTHHDKSKGTFFFSQSYSELQKKAYVMLKNVCGINKPAAGLCVSHLAAAFSGGGRKL